MRAGIFDSRRMPHDSLDVRHIARLARLDLDDAETATFQPQLQAILDHVEALSALDLVGIEPTAHPSPTFGPMRDDTPGESLTADAVIANAPDSAQGQSRVPKVVADA